MEEEPEVLVIRLQLVVLFIQQEEVAAAAVKAIMEVEAEPENQARTLHSADGRTSTAGLVAMVALGVRVVPGRLEPYLTELESFSLETPA